MLFGLESHISLTERSHLLWGCVCGGGCRYREGYFPVFPRVAGHDIFPSAQKDSKSDRKEKKKEDI